jgi:urease accessory protein UreF
MRKLWYAVLAADLLAAYLYATVVRLTIAGIRAIVSNYHQHVRL